jgi:spore maturation protein CgeB
LKPEEWKKIFSSSKISIAIHFQDGETLCHQASPRVYEALACRSFLLVDDQKDVKALFQDRKHLVIFKETEDLRQKITYYLDQPDERKKIANQGYEEIVHKHTYLHRIQEMFSVIEAGK